MSEFVTVRKDSPAGTVIIDRQDRRNALSTEVVSQLQQALDDFQSERSVRAVILTGAGNSFCSGTDLKELLQSFDQTGVEAQWYDQVTQLQQLLESMLRFPKPIIAAVNGWAVGSGLALMLACDMAIVSHSAKISLPEARLGLVAGLAVPLLAHRIGARLTNELLIAGDVFDAQRCVGLGLVNEAVSDELVWARSHEIARNIEQAAPTSQLMGKQLLNESIGERLFTQLSVGAANTAAARSTEPAREGVQAFLEKRSPRWE